MCPAPTPLTLPKAFGTTSACVYIVKLAANAETLMH